MSYIKTINVGGVEYALTPTPSNTVGGGFSLYTENGAKVQALYCDAYGGIAFNFGHGTATMGLALESSSGLLFPLYGFGINQDYGIGLYIKNDTGDPVQKTDVVANMAFTLNGQLGLYVNGLAGIGVDAYSNIKLNFDPTPVIPGNGGVYLTLYNGNLALKAYEG